MRRVRLPDDRVHLRGVRDGVRVVDKAPRGTALQPIGVETGEEVRRRGFRN